MTGWEVRKPDIDSAYLVSPGSRAIRNLATRFAIDTPDKRLRVRQYT